MVMMSMMMMMGDDYDDGSYEHDDYDYRDSDG